MPLILHFLPMPGGACAFELLFPNEPSFFDTNRISLPQ